ncbi:MAG: glycosyltransferase [Lachnospiraceae bacterium]|nr:glycosyltransferase [Lachnospiraceae bacterium]
MKISVIIPVYNSCRYLGTCVESIRKQSYENVEIILVDDGSTDGSGKVCDQFSENDKRVIVIHQKNAGASSARNTGLRVASGDYMMFMENDDYWNDVFCLESIVK